MSCHDVICAARTAAVQACVPGLTSEHALHAELPPSKCHVAAASLHSSDQPSACFSESSHAEPVRGKLSLFTQNITHVIYDFKLVTRIWRSVQLNHRLCSSMFTLTHHFIVEALTYDSRALICGASMRVKISLVVITAPNTIKHADFYKGSLYTTHCCLWQ